MLTPSYTIHHTDPTPPTSLVLVALTSQLR